MDDHQFQRDQVTATSKDLSDARDRAKPDPLPVCGISVSHPHVPPSVLRSNPFGQRLTTLMIAKGIADSAVPMSLLADHPNVQFNYYRKGIGKCYVEMH